MSRQSNDLRSQLDAAEERIRRHPGHIEHAELLALHQSLTALFIPNWMELRQLLDQASTDPQLAMELVQNSYRPDVRERFQMLTIQRLHNYGAATMTLVDHTRRLMRGRSGPIADEYEERKIALVQRPEVPFIQDLRNYMLHRRLPDLLHTVSVSAVNTDQPEMESEVQLSRRGLLTWDGWRSASRLFLENLEDAFSLRPIVANHGQLIVALTNWLLNKLAAANAPSLEDANRLVVERNAILVGTDDIEKAHEFTAQWTKMRETPGPRQAEEFISPSGPERKSVDPEL